MSWTNAFLRLAPVILKGFGSCVGALQAILFHTISVFVLWKAGEQKWKRRDSELNPTVRADVEASYDSSPISGRARISRIQGPTNLGGCWNSPCCLGPGGALAWKERDLSGTRLSNFLSWSGEEGGGWIKSSRPRPESPITDAHRWKELDAHSCTTAGGPLDSQGGVGGEEEKEVDDRRVSMGCNTRHICSAGTSHPGAPDRSSVSR